MNDHTKLVFVSYELEEAREFADQAKQVLENRGHRTWVWHHDRKAYGYLVDDIMDAIEACDFFLHICTRGSNGSRGQAFERDYAYGCGKDPPILLTFHQQYVPRMHKGRDVYYSPVTTANFADECMKVADQLSNEQLPERRIAVEREAREERI